MRFSEGGNFLDFVHDTEFFFLYFIRDSNVLVPYGGSSPHGMVQGTLGWAVG